MPCRSLVLALALALSFEALPAGAESKPGAVEWLPYSDAVFARARREKKLVILDLEAVWCHWCHVMDEKTYGDPRVAALLGERYLAIKVDQDARPDVSKRYEDWGWPATVVFDSDGRELARRRGYLQADVMTSMLEAFAESPTPGPSARPERPIAYARIGALTESLRRDLRGRHADAYDEENGGWGFGHKYVDAESLEYAFARAAAGDEEAARRARKTLVAGRALLDPVWGGVYQYSTGGGWKEPHFEKIVSMQAANLRVYARGYALFHDPEDLRVAREIRRYLNAFLRSPDGAYYVSQDADLVRGEHGGEYFARDDAGRRRLGIPRVDTSLYARENGWVIEALAALHGATGDREPLEDALRAARWVLAHRAAGGGGFSHGGEPASSSGLYLADTLAMGRAFLALADATRDAAWLERAGDAARFIARTFRATSGAAGYASSTAERGAGRPPRDENASLARFASDLARRRPSVERGAKRQESEESHTTARGRRELEAIARQAMRVAVTPALARRPSVGPVLLADLEMKSR